MALSAPIICPYDRTQLTETGEDIKDGRVVQRHYRCGTCRTHRSLKVDEELPKAQK